MIVLELKCNGAYQWRDSLKDVLNEPNCKMVTYLHAAIFLFDFMFIINFITVFVYLIDHFLLSFGWLKYLDEQRLEIKIILMKKD